MQVFLTLRDKGTGAVMHREINPLAEEMQRDPKGTINEWIELQGNAQNRADLELVSYRKA